MKLSSDGLTLTNVSNEDIRADGSITIPGSVTSIGDDSFRGCDKLRLVIADDIERAQNLIRPAHVGAPDQQLQFATTENYSKALAATKELVVPTLAILSGCLKITVFLHPVNN